MKKRSNLDFSTDYINWLEELKTKVRRSQLKAVVAVNQELLKFYWDLGSDIVEKQKSTTWSTGFLKQLSQDLMAEFPYMKGFSERNLKYIRQWFLFWVSKTPFGQQAVAQIIQVPWGHNLAILAKCKDPNEALYYVQNTITHSWSRSVLTHQIESGLWKREGKAITNFTAALPALRREWLSPSQEVQHRHGDWQANPSGESVVFRLGVIALAKGVTIACELCLDAKYHRLADPPKRGWRCTKAWPH